MYVCRDWVSDQALFPTETRFPFSLCFEVSCETNLKKNKLDILEFITLSMELYRQKEMKTTLFQILDHNETYNSYHSFSRRVNHLYCCDLCLKTQLLENDLLNSKSAIFWRVTP